MEGILALDPAGPIFSSNSENVTNANKLWPSDAKAVQGSSSTKIILLKISLKKVQKTFLDFQIMFWRSFN